MDPQPQRARIVRGDATITVTCGACQAVTEREPRAITRLVPEREYQFWCPECGGPTENVLSTDTAVLLAIAGTPYVPPDVWADPVGKTCESLWLLPAVERGAR